MPNCPSCDDVEMIAGNKHSRTCPECGYTEDN